jgi:hypothetical protein
LDNGYLVYVEALGDLALFERGAVEMLEKHCCGARGCFEKNR